MNRASLEHSQYGKAMERDFHLLGINRPAELIGRDPYQLFEQLSDITQTRHAACVLETFISALIWKVAQRRSGGLVAIEGGY